MKNMKISDFSIKNTISEIIIYDIRYNDDQFRYANCRFCHHYLFQKLELVILYVRIAHFNTGIGNFVYKNP